MYLLDFFTEPSNRANNGIVSANIVFIQDRIMVISMTGFKR